LRDDGGAAEGAELAGDVVGELDVCAAAIAADFEAFECLGVLLEIGECLVVVGFFNDGGGNGDGVERGAVVAFECFVAG